MEIGIRKWVRKMGNKGRRKGRSDKEEGRKNTRRKEEGKLRCGS